MIPELAILSGVHAQPMSVLGRAGVAEAPGRLLIKPDFITALDAAEDFLSGRSVPQAG